MQMRNAGVDKLSATEDHITPPLILERDVTEIEFYLTLRGWLSQGTFFVENKQKLSFIQKWTKNCFYPNLDEKKLFFVQVQSPKSKVR